MISEAFLALGCLISNRYCITNLNEEPDARLLGHPVVYSHFRYQLSTRVLDTKFDTVLEPQKARFAQPYYEYTAPTTVLYIALGFHCCPNERSHQWFPVT